MVKTNILKMIKNITINLEFYNKYIQRENLLIIKIQSLNTCKDIFHINKSEYLIEIIISES